MSKLFFMGLIGSMCLVSMSNVFAAERGCNNVRNLYDDIYCSAKIFVRADDELNQNYQTLRNQLNVSQRQRLRQSELNWIKQRDTQCTTDRGVDVDCRLRETQARNRWMKQRLQECESKAGCQTHRLK